MYPQTILHSFNGYRTCYYRTFAVGSASPAQRDAYTICRESMDKAIALVKPGTTTADICAIWPAAEEFGFATKRRPLRCNMSTVLGYQFGSAQYLVA